MISILRSLTLQAVIFVNYELGVYYPANHNEKCAKVEFANEILNRFNIEQNAYKAVYMRDYNYLIDYDTPILIKEQA
jgi:dTDP-4-dehydrorhamnose reductase